MTHIISGPEAFIIKQTKLYTESCYLHMYIFTYVKHMLKKNMSFIVRAIETCTSSGARWGQKFNISKADQLHLNSYQLRIPKFRKSESSEDVRPEPASSSSMSKSSSPTPTPIPTPPTPTLDLHQHHHNYHYPYHCQYH